MPLGGQGAAPEGRDPDGGGPEGRAGGRRGPGPHAEDPSGRRGLRGRPPLRATSPGYSQKRLATESQRRRAERNVGFPFRFLRGGGRYFSSLLCVSVSLRPISCRSSFREST